MEVEHEIARVVAVAALAAVHLFAAALTFLSGVPRSRWLSAAGGISVAYVFVHLLPELAAGQRALVEQAEGVLPFVEQHAYLLALVGFALFYGVEMASRKGAFEISIASFAVYNGVIGYVLAREPFDLRDLILFAVGIGLHFVVNDFSLREHHRDAYRRVGRFVVAGAIVAGWIVGQVAEIPEAARALLIAFIAGGVILNVVKEELPRERQSRFGAFALAAAAYSVLLLAA